MHGRTDRSRRRCGQIGTANDTVYWLSSYIQTKDMNKAREIAARMRTDNAYINYPTPDAGLPFGGNAEYGLEDFLEIKGIGALVSADFEILAWRWLSSR